MSTSRALVAATALLSTIAVLGVGATAAGKGLPAREPDTADRARAPSASLASAQVGSPHTSDLDPGTLERAQAIRRELNGRDSGRKGKKLRVTEASSTAVLESYTLLTTSLLATRVVPAGNGVHYALCPGRTRCPYPGKRHARPAAAVLPRRLALELALRTFGETSADLVSVSLPTSRFTILALERSEIESDPILRRLAAELTRDTRAAAAWPRTIVEQVTRPRVFCFLAIEPTPSGGESFGAIPRWPDREVDR